MLRGESKALHTQGIRDHHDDFIQCLCEYCKKRNELSRLSPFRRDRGCARLIY